MKTLYLLCGMPFSGKKTLAKMILEEIVNEMAKTFESPQADEIVIKYSLDQNVAEWIERYFVKSTG